MTARALGRVLSMALLLIICLPLWAICRLLGGGNAVVRFYLGCVAWLLGLRIRVEGKPVLCDALLVGNHISWLDIPALGGTVPAQLWRDFMSAALAVDRQRGPVLPAEFRRPEPERENQSKSPLPPEWSDATKQLREVATQLEELFGGR